MTLPRRARSIVVDGEPYRWLARVTDERDPTLVVSAEDGPVLTIYFDDAATAITPRLVAELIRTANERGWPSEARAEWHARYATDGASFHIAPRRDPHSAQ